MEGPRNKLKLQMNRFRKRQEGQIHPQATASSCSCACWGEIKSLKKQVQDLGYKMMTYAKVIREFEEIRGEIFGEIGIDEDCIQAETVFKGEQETLELEENDEDENIKGYDLKGLSGMLSVTEVEDRQEQDDMKFKNINEESEDYPDCVIVDSVSLASSPIDHQVVSHPISTGVLLSSLPFPGGIVNVQYNQEISGGNTEGHSSAQNQTRHFSAQRTEIARRKRKRQKAPRTTETPYNPNMSVELPYNCSLVCPHCTTGHAFKERGSLRRHIQHFHAERKTFVCIPCNKTFQYKEGLTYHKRSVHDGIRHLCGVNGCTSAYSTITALRKHQRVVGHTGDTQTIRIQKGNSYASYKAVT